MEAKLAHSVEILAAQRYGRWLGETEPLSAEALDAVDAVEPELDYALIRLGHSVLRDAAALQAELSETDAMYEAIERVAAEHGVELSLEGDDRPGGE
jgi:hypothetical protein